MLIRNLSQDLGQRYGDDGSGNFKPSDAQGPGGAFVIAWLDGQPVGCGALRPLEPGVGERNSLQYEMHAAKNAYRCVAQLMLRLSW